MIDNRPSIKHSVIDPSRMSRIQFVLFGFVKDLTSHLVQSPSIHSKDYASSGDHPTCLVSSPTKSESFMQYAG